MRRIVYLAGAIANLSYEDATAARIRARQCFVDRGWDVLDPMRGKEVLSTLAFIDEKAATRLLGVTEAAIVQRDFDDLRRADVILILSGDAPSWGTAFEWSLSHFHFQKPVVVVAGLDAPVRNHPWCKVMTSAFCSSVEEAADFIDRWLDRGYSLEEHDMVPPHRHEGEFWNRADGTKDTVIRNANA